MERLIALLALIAIAGYVFLAPATVKDVAARISSTLFSLLLDFLHGLGQVIKIATLISHYFGLLATAILMAASIIIVANEVLGIYGLALFSGSRQYTLWSALFEKPVFWASATTVIATTVAVSHMRRLYLDEEKAAKDDAEKSKREAQQGVQRDGP